MSSGMLRIGIVIMGAVLVILSFWKHSVKKLTVDYAVIWELLGALMILVGTVPVFSGWTRMLSPEMRLVVFCLSALILIEEIRSSLTVSQLTFKNREMAMHLALLNQESERVMDEVKELLNIRDGGREDENEKDSIRG